MIEILVGGYFEFGFCPPTDRHSLWIDVHYQVAFGRVMPTIVTAQARRLKTTDPCIVQCYMDIWSQYIQDHNLLERAYRVQRECTYPLQLHTPFNPIFRSKCNPSTPYADKVCYWPTGSAENYQLGLFLGPQQSKKHVTLLKYRAFFSRRKRAEELVPAYSPMGWYAIT
jgi:hypothetical protein